MAMKLLDADILTYALFEKHDAHPYCWQTLKEAVYGKVKSYMTPITLLEAYHALVNDYSVDLGEASYKLDGLSRSRKIRFMKISTEIARRALQIAKDHRARSFDAALIASAEVGEIPIVVSNDGHIARLCDERGLILENPIPDDVRERMKM